MLSSYNPLSNEWKTPRTSSDHLVIVESIEIVQMVVETTVVNLATEVTLHATIDHVHHLEQQALTPPRQSNAMAANRRSIACAIVLPLQRQRRKRSGTSSMQADLLDLEVEAEAMVRLRVLKEEEEAVADLVRTRPRRRNGLTVVNQVETPSNTFESTCAFPDIWTYDLRTRPTMSQVMGQYHL